MNAVNYIAKFVDNYGDNVWHRFVEGGLPTAALGVLAVFSVLTILWICLEVFRYVFYTLPERRKKSAKKDSTPAPAPSAEATAQVTQVSYANDGEIVAAIIAAITAAREEEGISPSSSFRVVSFRKKK